MTFSLENVLRNVILSKDLTLECNVLFNLKLNLRIKIISDCPENCHLEVELECDDFSPDPNAPRPFEVNPLCDDFFRAILGHPPLGDCQCKEGYIKDGDDLLEARYMDYGTDMCLKLSEIDDCYNGCVTPDGTKLRVRIFANSIKQTCVQTIQVLVIGNARYIFYRFWIP